ncbi:MAG: hypothetical protein A3K77_06370 [Euryarchaeota archaeon RBG_13_31_8]|nr:MAG: hypothetical protein A3K77_06370 [Euryarchaeota archaeon RBG_13_31_8]
MTENDKIGQEIIDKFKDIPQPTFDKKLSDRIEDCLCILTQTIKNDIRNRIVFELLFDFAILNNIKLKQKNYYQKVLLDAKCAEFYERSKKDGNNAK